VIGGLYRYVRNRMYVAVDALILGQALLFTSFSVLVHAVRYRTAVPRGSPPQSVARLAGPG
jgi:hypothetical protein